jgi:hypothetical protein
LRRFDGDRFHIDWHLKRVVEAIRLAASCPDKPEIADAIAADVARQEAKAALAARRRQKEETEAAQRWRREAEMSGLEVELAVLMAGDPDMCLLDAVELVTSDPGERLALYRALMEFEQNAGATCDRPRPGHLQTHPSPGRSAQGLLDQPCGGLDRRCIPRAHAASSRLGPLLTSSISG